MDTKKQKNNKTNNNYIVIAVIAVVIIVLIGFIILKGCSKSSNNEGDANNREAAQEKDIIAAYGMSKEDAIEVVKEIYNSDNYEFSAEINDESKYIVTVKNLINNNIDKFIVDPTSTSKSFYLITE